jgi:co-chaperonin GroES (HSP10)
MRPLSGRVIVQIPVQDEVTTRSGLVVIDPRIKEDWERKSLVADVLEVGEMVNGVRKGDKVLIQGSRGRFMGPDERTGVLADAGREVRCVYEHDIEAIIETEIETKNPSKN